jgi:hypothetical protein
MTMPLALKANWAVTAGLIPGTEMPEYSKGWFYTSGDWDKDEWKRGAIWRGMADAAHGYAKELEDGGLNWVKVEFIWL